MSVKSYYVEQPCSRALHRVEGMPFRWSLNPYVGCAHRCAFCYVRAFERRADRPADDRYGEVVRVKTNIAEQLERELRRPSWRREQVAIGTATDPYQPAEARYRLTRRCLELLARFATPASLVTRSPLVVRDVDVLLRLQQAAGVTVTLSIPTLDGELTRRFEPGAPPPQQRLRAVSQLREAGVEAGVAVAPILPGLTDAEDTVRAVLLAAREAGASFVWASPLRLPEGSREQMFAALARHRPDLLPYYERLYGRPALPRGLAEKLVGRVEGLKRELRFGEEVRMGRPATSPPRQLSLFG